MKGIILALAVIATVCAQHGHGGQGGFGFPSGSGFPKFPGGLQGPNFPKGPIGPGGRGHGFPLPPYLEGLDENARKEYFEIMKDHQLTFAQQKQKIKEWGQRFGIEAQVVEFDDKMKALQKELEQNVTDLIKKLPNAFQKISDFMKKEDQTPIQLSEAIKGLTKDDPMVYRVLKITTDLFMRMKHGFGGHKGPEGPGSFERPKGLSGLWGQMGPGGPRGFERPGSPAFGGRGGFGGHKRWHF